MLTEKWMLTDLYLFFMIFLGFFFVISSSILNANLSFQIGLGKKKKMVKSKVCNEYLLSRYCSFYLPFLVTLLQMFKQAGLMFLFDCMRYWTITAVVPLISSMSRALGGVALSNRDLLIIYYYTWSRTSRIFRRGAERQFWGVRVGDFL